MTIIDDAVNTVISTFGTVTDAVQGLLSRSLPNQVISYLGSYLATTVHHSTHSDVTVLNDTPAFAAPDAQYQRENSPTVSQFMNAANAEYTIYGTPNNMRPFEVDGRQLELVNIASGMSSRVWLTDHNQVIIAYSGTGGGDTALTTPLQVPGQVLTDFPLLTGNNSASEQDAVDWAQYVVQQAALQGISANDIFVTGHSLGGIEAEYVAQQTGLGGINFSGTGIPASDTAVTDDSNFVSVVNYGDVIGSLTSSVEGDQPHVAYDPEGGELPLRGTVVMVGDPQDQVTLANTGISNVLQAAVNFTLKGPSYHYPGNNAANLGVALQPFSVNQDFGGRARGEVFAAADLTLDQLIAANSERDPMVSSPAVVSLLDPAQAELLTLAATA